MSDQKEKLKFRINGKSIVYDGYPSARSKDLMDILVKMGVDDSNVIGIYRENIGDSPGDSDVVALFEEAKRIRREKKSKKAGDTGADATQQGTSQAHDPQPTASPAVVPTASSYSAAQPEQVTRLTLQFKGKQYAYEGLPSKKASALVELLLKHPDTPSELIVRTYRDNIPDHSRLSDDDILNLAEEAKQARLLKKQSKLQSQQAPPAPPPAAQQVAPPAPQPHESKATEVAGIASPRTTAGGPTVSGMSAIEEMAYMSSQERDSINSFINSVLQSQTPANAVAAASRPLGTTANAVTAVIETPTTATAASASIPATPPAAASVAATEEKHDGPKIAVYCQEEGSTVQRIIYAPKSATFEEFSSMVEKKFGRKMVLSFFEGEDKIEIDDDDVVQMFFELQSDGRKLRLICSLPETRRKVTDDKLTESSATAQAPPSATTAVAVPASKPAASAAVTQFASSGVIVAKESKVFSGHSAAVYCCSFSPKGDRFCTASRDHSVRIWNIATGAMTVLKGGHNGFVLSCDFSPSGNNIVSSADDCSIKIWNANTATKTLSLKGHDDKVYCVQYNSTGAYIVSGSCDRTVRVWNADSGAKQATLKGHDLAVFSCCFSNTDAGRFVASGSDDRLVKVWDWREGREVKNLIGHTGTVWSVKFSHHDKYIVSASMDHELKLWDVAAASCIRTMTGHMTPIHHAIFSPNDKYILSCARDFNVMVWDTETGKHLETIQGHRNTVYHLDMLGEQVLTSSLDDTIKLWSFSEVTK